MEFGTIDASLISSLLKKKYRLVYPIKALVTPSRDVLLIFQPYAAEDFNRLKRILRWVLDDFYITTISIPYSELEEIIAIPKLQLEA